MNATVGRQDQPAIPTYVVIPVKDNLPLTSALVAQLRDQGEYEAIFVFDNGSADDTPAWLAAQASRGDLIAIAAGCMTLHQMWNAGIALSRTRHPTCNIAPDSFFYFEHGRHIIRGRFLLHGVSGPHQGTMSVSLRAIPAA